MHEVTNIFHNLQTKLGIKYSEKHHRTKFTITSDVHINIIVLYAGKLHLLHLFIDDELQYQEEIVHT